MMKLLAVNNDPEITDSIIPRVMIIDISHKSIIIPNIRILCFVNIKLCSLSLSSTSFSGTAPYLMTILSVNRQLK